MKILAIGNSFSQDSTALVEDIAASAGDMDVVAANLYIGGCPLSHHAENLVTDKDEYEYQRHGKALYHTSIRSALESDSWDAVTLQQVSGLSGIYDSYHPYIDEVYRAVRALCPGAAVYLNRTWAYEKGSAHPDFGKYDFDREKMDAAIEWTYQRISDEFSIGVIPVGGVIAGLCELPEFSPAAGGVSLYRDGFHLSFTYGRFAAACVWLRRLRLTEFSRVTFVPEGADARLIKGILRYIDAFFEDIP